MQNSSRSTLNIILIFLAAISFLALLSYGPIHPSWGSINLESPASISVTGEAEGQIKNQIANFQAGMEAIEKDKELALETVNRQMNETIIQLKELGIPQEDIQTENIRSYQENENYMTDGRYQVEKGDWRASNQISIKVRDLEKVNKVLSILNNSGINNINGPYFETGDTAALEIELLAQAVGNARQKAEKIATENGQKIGGILQLYENAQYPIQPYLKSSNSLEMLSVAGDMAVLEPIIESGSELVRKNVSVTFELR